MRSASFVSFAASASDSSLFVSPFRKVRDLAWAKPQSFAKGSVESTHKVPTSHYHTKHCHAAVVSGNFVSVLYSNSSTVLYPRHVLSTGKKSDWFYRKWTQVREKSGSRVRRTLSWVVGVPSVQIHETSATPRAHGFSISPPSRHL